MKFVVELSGEYNGRIVDGIKVLHCFEVIDSDKTLLIIDVENELALDKFLKNLNFERVHPVKQISAKELEEMISAYREIQESPVKFS